MIVEHPTDEIMIGWVTGALDDDATLLFEAHIAACPECAARLTDEAALDVVMHAAAELEAELELELRELAEEPEVIELHPAAAELEPVAEARRGSTAWKQVLAAAAGFALLVIAGPNRPRTASIDTVEPAMSGAVLLDDAPAPYGDGDRSEDCSSEEADEGPVCTEDSLFAMASSDDAAPWSVSESWEPVSMPREECTTPVDTGESLTCDDWLSDDELSG